MLSAHFKGLGIMAMYFQDGIAIMGSQAKIPKRPELGCLEDSIIEGRTPEGSFLEVSAHPHLRGWLWMETWSRSCVPNTPCYAPAVPNDPRFPQRAGLLLSTMILHVLVSSPYSPTRPSSSILFYEAQIVNYSLSH